MTRRYALVGTGGRAVTWIDAMCGPHRDDCEVVGLCDPSRTRREWHRRRIERRHRLAPPPAYGADEFDTMIEETRPDVVAVTTTDCFHDVYIVRAMDLGCDAITEKPMATDAGKVNRILDAVDRTGKDLTVAFNYRYMPAFGALRRAVADGLIGDPKLVDFSWMLDTSHGADYFRRWHREKDRSGGLLVHKASHHFDLVNWWVSSTPAHVFAIGALAFYGAENAAARGEHYSYDRYTGHEEARADPFALFLDSHRGLRGLYLDAESDDGYLRDRNVFGQGITVEDTMSVTARYDNGAILSYSLVAYSPWEGLRVAITGTKGRLELFERHGSHVIAGQSDAELAAEQTTGFAQELWHHPMFQRPERLDIETVEGGHGGADPAMLAAILSADPPPDPLGRSASHVDGAASVLVGIAANCSMDSGEPVACGSLVRLPVG